MEKLGVINDNIELINIKNKGAKRFFEFDDKLILAIQLSEFLW